MNFEEFIYNVNVWGNIDPSYEDNNVKHMAIEVTYYDDDDNEMKIGTVCCRLYNPDNEDVRVLMDCDSGDAITTALAIADKFRLNLDGEMLIAYIENICLEKQWKNQGIETYILEHFAEIIKTLVWHIPTLIIMCATEEEFKWMPKDVACTDKDGSITYCCVYSTELDWRQNMVTRHVH